MWTLVAGLFKGLLSALSRIFPFLVAWKLGKTQVESKMKDKVLDAVKETQEIDDEIDSLSDADVVERLRKYARD